MLYKRGLNWSYKFKWTVGAADGSRETYVIRKSAHTTNSRKAREVEEEHRRALRLGRIHPLDPWPKPPAPQAPTLREFKDRFLEYAKQHTKPSTAVFYEECTNRILKFSPLADALLTAITGELVAKYAAWRKSQATGNSVSSINAELRTLRRLFSLAEEWGILDKAPTIHELPGQKIRERVIAFDEEGKYLGAASPTLHDLAILAVDTGLRPDSELFPLEWKNVHLDAIRDAPSGYLHVRFGKTGNAVRNVPLAPRVRAILGVRKATNPSERFVFPGSGRSGHITTVQNAHRRAIRKARLEHFEFYCWRHTFGTRCAESGMDRFSLARLMGHSSPRVAERYYVHVSERHVNVGFERFVEYQTTKQAEALRPTTNTVQ